MDWNDVRPFLAVARGGSLSAAARELGVEHSTVARRLAALEDAVGCRLFDRLPRGYALTAEGRHALDLAEGVERAVQALERGLRGEADGLSGPVRLSAPPVFASAFLAPRLAALRLRHPGLVLELVGETQAVSLVRGEADLALRLTDPGDDSLIGRRVGEMAFALYAAPEVAASPPESWGFLAYDDSLDHVPQQHWLRAVAAGRRLVFRTNDLASLHAAARTGMGVAALPCFLGDGDPVLRRLPETGLPPPRRALWLVVHPDLRRSPRVRAVFDGVAEAITAARSLLTGETA